MILEYFNELSAGLETKLNETSDGIIARKRLILEVARLGTRLYTPGQQIAWCGVLVPYDLLNAMGVTSCFVEFVGGLMASTGGADSMFEASEQAGFATDSCSYHRAVCGAAEQGLMPEPTFLIATSAPCSGGLAVLEHLANHFKKDLFVIHTPVKRDENAVAYLADQLRAMVDFVTQHTGSSLDTERLHRAVEYTNQARSAWMEMSELLTHIPTPARKHDMRNFGIAISLFLGTPEGVEIARTYRDEFARKVEAGIAGTANAKIRLMWLQNRLQFRNPIEKLLDEDFSATVVVDELNQTYWDPIDPEDPYSSMARRMLSIPLAKAAEYRIENLQHLAKAYSVDGAINPCHWGCRQGTGSRGLIEEGLKKIGVPVLNLEVDCVDQRHFSEGQIRTRLQAFMEMLIERCT
ncbi:MAG: 2-hydroxyacyl-CoA dehydratase [Proteobacteria bacterium]|nr:2-hydroxyacyl-CoA dehydratase [Pseudomonadota bacterium]